MAQRISVLVSLDGSDEGLKKAISSAEQSLGTLASAGATVGEKVAAGTAQVRSGMAAMADQIDRAKTQFLAFVSINWAIGKAQELVQVADAWNTMAARLKLATASQNEYNTAQKELFNIAQRVGVPLQETATLYGKLQQAVRMLGGEQKQALTITESISQALRISGASATESQSALLQFGQALSAGVLRGEEFNSVVENSPRLAKALADGLDVPIGRLRKMAEEGKLTADTVVNALLSQKDVLATEYAQLPQTVSASFERLRNAFGAWLTDFDKATGATAKLADAFTWLSKNIDTVMKVLGTLTEVTLAALAYRLIPALITAWQTAGAAAVTAANASVAAWATLNTSITGAIASVGLLKTAFAVLGAAVVGWEIGTWLSEKFAVVKQAGVVMVAALMNGIELMRFQWEAFAALFTGDTIAAATKRHQERLAEMNGIFKQMFADAGAANGEVAKTAQTAGDAAAEVAKRLEAVRQGTQEAMGRGVEAVNQAIEKLKARLGEVEQAISKANGTVNESLGKMSEAYKGMTTLVEDELQKQIKAVQARYADEVAALHTTGKSQGAQIAEGTRLLGAAVTEEVRLRQSANVEALRLIDEEGKARIAAAKLDGQTALERSNNVTRVENDILTTKRKLLATAADEYRTHINVLNQEIDRHLQAVMKVEEQKRQVSMTTDERIREIMRSTMSDYEATEDRKRQISEYQSKARILLGQGEFDQAQKFAQKALDLSLQVASEETRNRGNIATAIGTVKTAEDLLIQTLNGEKDAHIQAADAAKTSRAGIAQTLEATETKISSIKEALQGGLEVQVFADTIKFEQAISDLTAALAQKEILLPIKADLTAALAQLQDYEQLLKEGKTLPLDADVSKAQTALDNLKQYAQDNALVDLKVATEKAEASITGVASQIEALNELQTESKHWINTNAEEAAGDVISLDGVQTTSEHLISTNASDAADDVLSLDGVETSSRHTVYVTKVETNATGGLVGAGIAGFASGGPVGAFPRMGGGTVPGSGNGDTVPRTLDAGSFVLRKAAVQKYGTAALSRLANGVAHFATGGLTGRGPASSTGNARNRIAEFMKRVSKGGVNNPSEKNTPTSEWGMLLANSSQVITDMTASAVGLPPAIWGEDIRSYLNRTLNRIRSARSYQEAKGIWEFFAVNIDSIKNAIIASKQLRVPLAFWGGSLTGPGVSSEEGDPKNKPDGWTDAEWDAYKSADTTWGKKQAAPSQWDLLQRKKKKLAEGGSLSDTVPAMLTPGEFVVNRSAVARYGAGLFDALNRMALPVRGFASGGIVTGDSGSGLPSEQSSMGNPWPLVAYAKNLLDKSGKAGSEFANAVLARNAPAIKVFLKKVTDDPTDRLDISTLYRMVKAVAVQVDQSQSDGAADMDAPSSINDEKSASQVLAYADNLLTKYGDYKKPERNWTVIHSAAAIRALQDRVRRDSNNQEAIAELYQRVKSIWTYGVGSKGLAEGGSLSDTAPAMLTPGEYVVNRTAVARYGAGLFAALNSLAVPAQAFVSNMRGYASGGLVPGYRAGSLLDRATPGEVRPDRTVRVEFAAGGRTVEANIDARDESRLLDILKMAQYRASPI